MIEQLKQYIQDENLHKDSPYYSRRLEQRWRRFYLFSLLRDGGGYSLPGIAKLFGLNHATVINGIQQAHLLRRDKLYLEFTYSVREKFPCWGACPDLNGGFKPLEVSTALISLEYGRLD